MLYPTEYDDVVITKGSKTIDAFTSRIIHAWTKTVCLCEVECDDSCPSADEGSLPQGLMIQNAYTEMHNGSKNVAIMVKNSMMYSQTLKKKIQVARIVGMA